MLADGDGEGEVPRPDGFHEEEVFLLGGLVEDAGLVGVDGEGFFAEDGFVGFQAEHHVLVVVRVRGCNIDDVDCWVFDQVSVGAVCGAFWIVLILLWGDSLGDEFLRALD